MCRENMYKHIIWVDDFDDKNITLSNIPTGDEWDEEEISVIDRHEEDIKLIFGDKYAKYVKLYMNIPDVLEFIDKNLNLSDCIILDVNLNKSLDNAQKDKITDLCKQKGIKIDKEIGKYGGYYIFLYLLKSGFPTDHICIFTGNKGDDNSTGLWEKVFLDAGIFPPESIKRTDKIALQKWIDNCYVDQYYKIRRLVYKACEYWKNKLSDTLTENIIFNKIYYTDKVDSMVEISNFISMLERVEMLFTIMRPQDSESVYYQALQIVAMFHEESAKIDIFDKKSNRERYAQIKNYHQAVRNYRNWSAHNQFSDSKMGADLFSYIFCVALRSYFGDLETQFKIENEGKYVDCYSSYEKEYFDTYMNMNILNTFEEKYKDAFNRHFEKVKRTGDKKCWDCKDINELLLASGRCRSVNGSDKMYFQDLLLNIIDNWITQTENYECMQDRIGCEYTIRYQWNSELQSHNANFLEEVEKDSLKHLAYILFTQY